MRKFLLALPLLALTGACGSLAVGDSERLQAAACDRPMVERFARQVLIDARLSTVQTVAFDCDGDGVPDDLGRWIPPGE